jgi:putative DNA primase/helicase
LNVLENVRPKLFKGAMMRIFDATAKQPSNVSQPTSFTYGRGRFQTGADGVFFCGKDREGNDQSAKWICSSLHVVAKTRNERNGEWGRLLEWHDDDGKRHQWAMPLELLEGDGTDVRRELARLGLQISSSQTERGLLSAYIKVFPVEARARCVDRLGWHEGVFVTPLGSIGNSKELMVFQNSHAIEPAYSVAGTATEWRSSVASLAQGNSRLTFAISAAFAGALADILGEDSGGFHFRGASSSGKSTSLRVASSVWGNPSRYVRLWRGTVNGLEGMAVLHNDGLLILDEISQIDPAAAGDAAYMLANGQGKVRAQRNGLARAPQRWRLLFLSAGEESLTAIMSRAGKRTSAGQEIRLADIEADAGAGMGIFEKLHEMQSSAAIADAVKTASDSYHGAVGVAWLEHLAAKRSELASPISDSIKSFITEAVPAHAAGQVERVARRFALVAVAGELATDYGLTGWTSGEATHGARKCFNAWIEAFGDNGDREGRYIVAHARAFFEMHGASRFEDIRATNEQRVHNRVGFFRDRENNSREFLVLPEAFRSEICQGFNEKTVKRKLIEACLLLTSKDGQPSQNVRLPGLGSTKVYVFRYTSE